MRKLTLLIVFMMVMALTTYADAVVGTVSGDATLTFGVNLNDPLATGFLNEATNNITFTLVSGSAEKGAEEDVYGYIKVTGITIDMNTADGDTAIQYNAGSVDAKIMFPGGWVNIRGGNKDCDFIDNVQDPDGVAALAPAVIGDAGVTLGIDGALALEISLNSTNNWTSDNDYSAHIKATLSAAPITLAVAAGMDLMADPTIMAGAKLTLDAAPINIWGGIDFAMVGTASSYEAGAGLTFTVVDGMTIAASMSIDNLGNDMDAKVVITEGDSDSGIVPVVGMTVTVGLFNLMQEVADTLIWTVDVAVNAIIPKGKIFAEFGMGSDEIITLKAGVEMGLITNVVNTLQYESTSLTDVGDPITTAADAGVIKLITKIAL